MKKAVFLSLNAFGDTLCTTPVIRAFRHANPDTTIVFIAQAAPFCRVLDGNPDIDLLLYSERLYLHGIPEDVVPWLSTLPLDLSGPAFLYRLDLKLACTRDEHFREHISKSFARLFDVRTESVRPIVVLSDQERRAARIFAERPYVVLSTHSVSNPMRPDGRGKRKDWPLDRWQDLVDRLHQLGGPGALTIYQIGSERDDAPALTNVTRLYGLPVKVVAALLERAAAVVTVENGIGHLCAAVDAAAVIIYSDLMPIEWASCPESATTRILYGDPLERSCDDVLKAVEGLLFERGVAV